MFSFESIYLEDVFEVLSWRHFDLTEKKFQITKQTTFYWIIKSLSILIWNRSRWAIFTVLTCTSRFAPSIALPTVIRIMLWAKTHVFLGANAFRPPWIMWVLNIPTMQRNPCSACHQFTFLLLFIYDLMGWNFELLRIGDDIIPRPLYVSALLKRLIVWLFLIW